MPTYTPPRSGSSTISQRTVEYGAILFISNNVFSLKGKGKTNILLGDFLCRWTLGHLAMTAYGVVAGWGIPLKRQAELVFELPKHAVGRQKPVAHGP